MKQPRKNIDGFRAQTKAEIGKPRQAIGDPADEQARSTIGVVSSVRQASSQTTLRREIGKELAQIDDESEPPRKQRHRPTKKPHKRKWLRRTVLILLLIMFIAGGYVAVRLVANTSKVFNGNLLGLFSNKELKVDENGRSNILIFGTSEDDPGHPGAYLTDSLMVVSIDQKAHNAYMISIPRDLWVNYGAACNAGYRGKINEVYGCYSNNGKNEAGGTKVLRKVVGEVLGLDIQYYVHVNYTVVREAVDAVGGVEVVIESRDPRGILDRNFDWNCHYTCYYVKYPNGPTGTLDGKHALFLARARGDVAPTYGLERSNYDRELNQQKILKALQQKAVSAGTLTNVGKVTSLMDVLGKNLRTNFDTAEIRTLIDIGNKTTQQQIQSISLIDAQPALFGSGPSGSVAPTVGTFDYSAIHAFLAQKLSKDGVVREAAPIAVLNASDAAGLASSEADKLRAVHFTVARVGNAQLTSTDKVVIYQMGALKSPATKKRLEERYGVIVKQENPPFAVSSGSIQFVVVLVHVAAE